MTSGPAWRRGAGRPHARRMGARRYLREAGMRESSDATVKSDSNDHASTMFIRAPANTLDVLQVAQQEKILPRIYLVYVRPTACPLVGGPKTPAPPLASLRGRGGRYGR